MLLVLLKCPNREIWFFFSQVGEIEGDWLREFFTVSLMLFTCLSFKHSHLRLLYSRKTKQHKLLLFLFHFFV